VGETIRFVAESAGMEARSFFRPQAFFEAIDDWQPTHIVLDLVMPEMDGVEIMRHLAERRCEARILILSGVGRRALDAARCTGASTPIQPTASARRPRRAEAPQSNEEDLRTAIDERQFEVYYQPKIHCGSGQVSGFEALVRWWHPVLGLVMPDAFIPLAERLNVIDRLTEQILDEAMRWMRGIRTDMPLSLSVNLSAKALVDIGLDR